MPAIVGVIGAVGAVGAAAGAAGGIASIGLAGGLALGASVVGAALTVTGELTGSKTLKKVGLGLSLAGTAGSLASSATRSTSADSDTSSFANAASDVADDLDTGTSTQALLNSKTTGAADVIAENKFTTFDLDDAPDLSSSGSFSKSVAGIPQYAPGVNEPSLFEKVNNNINKYNGILNIAAGAGQALLGGERIDAQRDIARNQLDFQKEQDTRRFNTGAGSPVARSVALNPGTQSLLRRTGA